MTTRTPYRLLLSTFLAGAALSANTALAKTDRGGRSRARVAAYRAAVDFGSSSAKLLVLDRSGRAVVDVKQGTKLGAGVGADRLLPAANQRRGLSALRRFIGVAAGFGIAPADLALGATAATRNTTGIADASAHAEGKKSGAEYLRDDIARGLGIHQARILSGRQEAELGFRGALADWPQERLQREMARGGRVRAGAPLVVVIDTGGSSNQTTVGTPSGKIEAAGSIQIGSHRVRQLMEDGATSKVTYSASELAQADRRLARVMTRLPVRHALVKDAALVVTGGFGKFLRAHFGRDRVTRGEIEALRVELCAKDLPQRGRFVRRHQGRRNLLTDQWLRALGIETTAAARSYADGLPAKATLMLRVLQLAGLTAPTDTILLSATDTRHALIADLPGSP